MSRGKRKCGNWNGVMVGSWAEEGSITAKPLRASSTPKTNTVWITTYLTGWTGTPLFSDHSQHSPCQNLELVPWGHGNIFQLVSCNPILNVLIWFKIIRLSKWKPAEFELLFSGVSNQQLLCTDLDIYVVPSDPLWRCGSMGRVVFQFKAKKKKKRGTTLIVCLWIHSWCF